MTVTASSGTSSPTPPSSSQGIAIAAPLTSDNYGSGADPVVVIPWDLLAAVAVGVPLLAIVVTGLAVRSRLPMARRVAG